MSNDHTNVLLEEMNGKFDTVIEAVGQMQDQLKAIPKREEFDDLKADVKVIKAAVINHSNDINDHEKRITRLEVSKSRR